MQLSTEICELNGTLLRKSDSRYAVSLWYVPGGCDYANARVIVGFWPEDQKENAEAFNKKYDDFGTMASLIDLKDPKAEGIFKLAKCKHCSETVSYNFLTEQWMSDKVDHLKQYCWVDPVKGSQLHEVQN